MLKKFLSMLALCLSLVPAQALPIEALTAAISKIVKGAGGHADEAARGAGKATDTVAHPKPGPDTSLSTSPHSHKGADSIDAGYHLTEPVGKSQFDRESYKKLRDAAIKGDTSAMISMSEMTRKGLVVDGGEPYFSYWLVQAARVGSQQASRHLSSVCAESKEKRATDRRFDQECSRIQK